MRGVWGAGLRLPEIDVSRAIKLWFALVIAPPHLWGYFKINVMQRVAQTQSATLSLAFVERCPPLCNFRAGCRWGTGCSHCNLCPKALANPGGPFSGYIPPLFSFGQGALG